MKNTKVIVIAVLLVLALGGGAWKLLSSRQAPPRNTDLPRQEAVPGGRQAGSSAQITYTDQGFSPALLNVKKGDTVMWKNESTKDMWPASAMHPTHAVYPGSGIKKCNTAEQPSTFDACSTIAPGGSWSFKFLEAGSWKFHNHLSPTQFGTINAE